jgi:inosine-uridine nucleoside N-ribohydrolase
MKKIPVILDTDIGIDIDDTWALAFLLNCPELDLRLVLVGTGDVDYRAKIAAKFLQSCGRDDIPVGIGLPSIYEVKPQEKWVENYSLSSYKGGVYRNGIEAMIDIIASYGEITLLSIGPVSNIAEAIARAPEICSKVRFVGMQGSINYGLGGKKGRIAEYNVVQDIPAAQKVFAADWKQIKITPLDTCGIVKLEGEKYQNILKCEKVAVKTLLENYKCWDKFYNNGEYEFCSSALYDTVAVYLAFSDELVNIETINLKVDDDGYFVDTLQAKPVRCATSWKSLAGFEDILVARLTL